MRKIQYLFLLFILLLSSCIATKPVSRVPKPEHHLNDSVQRQFLYYYYDALKQKDNKQYDQALETLLLCEAIDSLDAGVQSELGILYSIIGLNDDARRHLANAVRLQPRNWWFSMQLVSFYTQLNDSDNAIKVANQIQTYYPDKQDIYSVLSTLYKQTKQYEKAIGAFDKLESLGGINPDVTFEKVNLYWLLKRPKDAEVEFDKLIKKYPQEAFYRIRRGDFYLQQNMPDKAFEVYQEVLKTDPQNPFLYISLSEYYNSVNQPAKAMESIVSALKNDQLDVDTKMKVLGKYVEKMVRDSTKLAETESLFKLLVDRYPLEEQVHGYYAVYLQFRNRTAEAISEVETMLTINPKNNQTWLQLIQLTLAEQNFKQLVVVTDRAIEKVPKLAVWYFYKGIAQYQLTDYQAALTTYKTGLPFITPDQPTMKSDFYAQIADIYFKTEKKDSAFANYENSLAANPKNIMVMNNYAYYLSLEKAELKKAERMSAKTVELEPKNSTYLDTYAWILYQEGNYSLAKFYIERAIDNLTKDVDPGVVLEHYGDILWMSGRDDKKDDAKALDMWQRSYDSGNKTEELKQKIKNKGWERK